MYTWSGGLYRINVSHTISIIFSIVWYQSARIVVIDYVHTTYIKK